MASTAIPMLNPKDYAGKIFLNGEFVLSKSKHAFLLKNPKDGSVVVEGIPICNEEDVDLAVDAAEAAFSGPWSKFTQLQRTECLQKLAALVEDQLIPILTLDSYTSGNPVSLIPTREKNYIKNGVLYYSGWADKLKGDYFPADDGTWCTVCQRLSDKCRLCEARPAPATWCLCCYQRLQRPSRTYVIEIGPMPGYRQRNDCQAIGEDAAGSPCCCAVL